MTQVIRLTEEGRLISCIQLSSSEQSRVTTTIITIFDEQYSRALAEQFLNILCGEGYLGLHIHTQGVRVLTPLFICGLTEGYEKDYPACVCFFFLVFFFFFFLFFSFLFFSFFLGLGSSYVCIVCRFLDVNSPGPLIQTLARTISLHLLFPLIKGAD